MSEPLTPAEADLRGMPYMPLDIVRLFDSTFYLTASGDEFRAGLSLWAKSFLQVPAGSLPDDDHVLAQLSGAGTKWKRVKAMALRKWVKCSDGRLYHPTVAEKVIEAWKARLAQRARTEAARAAKADKKSETVVPEKPVAETVKEPVTGSVTDDVTGSKGREVKGSKEKNDDVGLAQSASEARLRALCLALGLPPAPIDWPPPWIGLGTKLETWLAGGADWHQHIVAAASEMTRKPGMVAKGVGYLSAIVVRLQREAPVAKQTASSSAPDPRAPESEAKAWARLAAFERGEWFRDGWGAAPDEPGCLVPSEILEAWRRKAA